MKDNLPVLIIMVLIVIAVLVFVIMRNRKDEKKMEGEMDETLPQAHKHPGEDDAEQ